MLKRKITQKMIEWKRSLTIKKKALIIKGLRQVGKTTSVLDFAKNEYENVAYINFTFNKSLKDIFDSDLNVDEIIRNLTLRLKDITFIPYKTVIIFDELQECPGARTAIKLFMLDGRFDIIATGSLLGLRGYNKGKSYEIPVGFEEIIEMYPLDFEEYLWARGVKEEVIDYIKDCFNKKTKVDEFINNELLNIFKEYICVGGMPDVVDTFLKTNDFNEMEKIKRSLLNSFQDDFGKHLEDSGDTLVNNQELNKIMTVYRSIPNQLAKENKKFMFSQVKEKGSNREFGDAINWLIEYGLVSKCYNLKSLELPLEGNKIEDCFKLYFNDTGLFLSLLDLNTYKDIIDGTLKVYKGAIYENVIADIFHKLGKKLYYFNKTFEIDFITKFKDEVTAIEVKSTNGNAKALKELITNPKYNIKSNFKLIYGNVGINPSGIVTIPLYMAFLIN